MTQFMESLPDIHRYPLEVPQSCPLMVSPPRKGKNKLECPFKRATGLQKKHIQCFGVLF